MFSVLDLTMAYQQIPILHESKAYLTINTTKGPFAFNRLPAGISSAPGIFQRLMDALFAGIPGVCVYLDDILVSGKTEPEHDKNLDLVFTVLWAPLYELLRKDTPWNWGKEQSKVFKQCKTLLHCDSLLLHYDPSKQLVLACDASTKGVDYVLSHLLDGVEHPIAFYSRTLKPAKNNYLDLDKEALAFICGVKKFHCYLYGRSVIIKSDHKPLEKLLHEKNKLSHMAAPRIKRWYLDLSAYDYT